MKKTILLFITFLLSTFVVNAQYFDWVKSIGVDEFHHSMNIDSNGNVYISEGFPSDNFTSEYHDYDFSIRKIDPSGTEIWKKMIGGHASTKSNSIATDRLGNIYNIGSFHGIQDFNPGSDITYLTSTSGDHVGFDRDIFIQKLDSIGNLIWAKSFGRGHNPLISVSNKGEIYSIGNDSVQRLDTSGNILWKKSVEVIDAGRYDVFSLITDDFGNLYVGKNAFTTFTKYGYYYSSIIIEKFNSEGERVWMKKIGERTPKGNSLGNGMAVDTFGNIYQIGFYKGTVDFDPNIDSTNLTNNNTKSDIFIQKIDMEGNLIWVKSISGNIAGIGEWRPLHEVNIAVDISGNIYTTGTFFGTTDFDPNDSTSFLTAIQNDIFIQKLDTAGNLLWVKSIATNTIHPVSMTIGIDNIDNIYTLGSFKETVDFDPNEAANYLTSASGFRDIFLQKLTKYPKIENPLGIEPIKQSKIKLYPNPTNDLLNIELPATVGTAQFSIVNYMGQVVHQGNLNRSKKVVNLSSLSAGIYQVNMILSSGEKYFEKIVLTK